MDPQDDPIVSKVTQVTGLVASVAALLVPLFRLVQSVIRKKK